MKRNKIMMIDDDVQFLNIYSRILERLGFAVDTFCDAASALVRFKDGDHDIVITDMYMPTMSGLDVIRSMTEWSPNALILVMTGEGTVKNAVEAIKAGAQSYLQKPFEVSELEHEVNKLCELASKRFQNDYLMATLKTMNDPIVGQSKAILDMKDRIKSIAKTNSSIMIQGESGTGKELIAQAIHEQSDRADFPMVKINCAALSPSLLESELFGHEKGAFTGAIQTKKGLFESANGSTLFLDEIGEMPLEMQAKLLRVLQEKTFVRVGGNTLLKSDFRLVCATHRNLEELIEQKKFRNDLYYRINVVPISIPPLRDRKEDLNLLIEYFSQKFSAEMNRTKLNLSDEQMNCLLSYNWPGNIRELKNIIERLCVFSEEGFVSLRDFPNEIVNNKNVETVVESYNLKDASDEFEKALIRRALNDYKQNISATANALGLARKNLYAKMKKYNLG